MKGTGLTRAQAIGWARAAREGYERRLAELVGIPSVSVDPERRADIRRAAAYAAEMIHAAGGDATIYNTGGHPLVHGRLRRGDGLPTVTVYNHLDVQPAEGPQWRTDPFRLTPLGDRYFGRGTTDDKGPALAALFGARLAHERDVPVNVHFLWELEEEIGSPSFAGCLRENAAAFATESVVVSDTIWVSRRQPACPAGLRGLQGIRLTLRTAQTDQHSGTTGGAARNPVAELADLIAAMLDAKTGRVKIPGFYDDVVRPSKQELADLTRSGFSVAAFKRDHGLRSLRVTDPLEVMKRIWLEPTLEVHGIAGGYQGPGIKTIVPHEATAILSCRLVPRMSPARVARLVRDFARKRYPDMVVESDHALQPFAGRSTGFYADAVREAIRFGFGRSPVFVREGGSIGAVVSMEKILRVPVLFLGLSLPEHGYHAPNECFDWPQAEGGIASFARYFEAIAGGVSARAR